MKMILAILMVMFSANAFAAQTVNCRELNRDGSIKANGGKVRMQLEFGRTGRLIHDASTVKVKGFARRGSDILNELTFISVNEGANIHTRKPYTTFFYDDPSGYLDIQLQFDVHVVKQNFRNQPATFVIGSEDANPENYFAYGYKVTCNSRY